MRLAELLERAGDLQAGWSRWFSSCDLVCRLLSCRLGRRRRGCRLRRRGRAVGSSGMMWWTLVALAGAAWPADLADVAVSLEDGSAGLLPGACAVAPVAHVSSANGDDPAGRAVPGRRAPVELPHVSDYDNTCGRAVLNPVSTGRTPARASIRSSNGWRGTRHPSVVTVLKARSLAGAALSSFGPPISV